MPQVLANQEDNPGVGIRFNGDDDDNDGRADSQDNNGVADEDDLLRIDLQFGVQQPPAGIDYYLKRNADVLQVWTGPTKPGNGLFGNNNKVRVSFGAGETTTLWVEWKGDQQPVNAVLTFEARNANGQVVGQADSLTFYRFQTTVIVIGGFRQNPDPTGQNQQGNGLFNLGRRLYAEDGYDVHLFGQDEQVREGPNIGTGAAYNWALRAVNQHNITNVVVMGFSWVGEATFNLLDRINRDLGNAQPPFARRFHVPFTAYVDAIVHGRTAAQVNRPPVSRFHVNYYQQVDRFDNPIRGAAVPGSNVDRDVNNPRINAARELVHTTIDDDLNVQDELRRQLLGQANQR